jgi:hypothetical protein
MQPNTFRQLLKQHNIPLHFYEDKLAELYDLIHYFRLGLGQESLQPRTPGLLPGKLGDAFFEPLPEKELQKWK